MTINFTCANCHNEYPRITPDEKIVRKFRKNHPESDINSAILVCGRCYEIALRALKTQRERQNWLSYVMNN